MKSNNLIQLIRESKAIAVIAHINPDGDSIGSILGLGLALKKLSDHVDILMQDDFPGKFNFLPGVHHVKKPSQALVEYDLIFVLDCGDAKRLGDSIDLLQKAKAVINIDHHISNDSFGTFNILDPKASSTCQLIYSFILEDLQLGIDEAIATCLYTGITSDTGSFKYDNTSPVTLRAAAHLMELGAATDEISFHLYHNNSLSSVRFLAAILDKMEILFDGRVALITITQAAIKAFSVQQEELEGLINYCRDIEGVEVAVSLKENENGWTKVSFRGKSYVDVNQLATVFGGGGHKKASGATLEMGPQEAKDLILQQIQKMI